MIINNTMKKQYIIIPVLILFILLPFIAFGALETDYQKIGGVGYQEGESLPVWIRYITQFLVFVGVFIAVFVIVRGGFSWMTASGDPVKIKDAKEKISAAVFGLIIVLGASLFLSSINPELTSVGEEDVRDTIRETIVQEAYPPGFYLSEISLTGITQEEMDGLLQIEENPQIYRIGESHRDLRDIGQNIKTVRIVNQLDREGELTGFYYILILHEERGYRGKCEILVNETKDRKDFDVEGKAFRSVTVLQVAENPPKDEHDNILGGITLYQRPDFRGEFDDLDITLHTHDLKPLSNTNERVWSVDVLRKKSDQGPAIRGDEGNFGIILTSGGSWESMNECGVFLDSRAISDLKMHHMNRCDEQTHIPIYSAHRSCSTHYLAVPLYRGLVIFDYIIEGGGSTD